MCEGDGTAGMGNNFATDSGAGFIPYRMEPYLKQCAANHTRLVGMRDGIMEPYYLGEQYRYNDLSTPPNQQSKAIFNGTPSFSLESTFSPCVDTHFTRSTAGLNLMQLARLNNNNPNPTVTRGDAL